ncbi:MAG: glycosyltransferase family 39 protein [Phaeodactylibacter sp.]|nr:glycosyltransferase family 39 protein [Phaeodactylibacter sp.]
MHQYAYTRILLFTALLALLGLFLNLGVQPVYLEEPRRATIAMEMEENGNFIVPTQFGEFYYKKPPVFNWVVWTSAKVTGGYTAWALRLPTVLSIIFTSVLLFWLGRRYVNPEFGWLSALLFPISGGLYFYFSLLGEIDLFYTLVTFAGFATLFHFQQQGRYRWMFFLTYALAAVGTLTKGLPSVLFLGLSVLAWLWWEGELKRLLSLAHLAGILVYGALVGGYLLAYHQYNDIGNYLQMMVAESSERTVAENGLLKLLEHIFMFPLDTIKDLLPGGLLLLFAIRRDVRSLLLRNKLLTFVALMFLVNVLPYWISPGARQRYIYMLYPFLLMIGLYAYQHREEVKAWRFRAFRILSGILVGAVALGSLAIPFIPGLEFLNYRWPLALGGFLAGAAVFYFYLRQPQRTLILLILATAVARLLFDFTVLPQRAHESDAQVDIEIARAVDEIVGDTPLYLYQGARISFSAIFYLNQIRGKTLRRNYELEKGAYYIALPEQFPGEEVLYEIPYNEEVYGVVKYK